MIKKYISTFNCRTVLQGYLLYLLQHNKFLPCFPLGHLLHAAYLSAGLAREFIPRLSWIIQTLRPIVLKSFHWTEKRLNILLKKVINLNLDTNTQNQLVDLDNLHRAISMRYSRSVGVRAIFETLVKLDIGFSWVMLRVSLSFPFPQLEKTYEARN